MTEPQAATVGGALACWTDYRTKLAALNRLAPSTLANQTQVAGTLERAIGAVELSGLRKSHVDLFVAERLQTCRPVTVSAELAVLRQFLNWCIDERLLSERPRLPTVSVPNIERLLPGDQDFAWFLRTMPHRHADALRFMCLTGLSPHELARLRVGDRDFQTGELLIGHRDDFRVKQPSRRRRVPLNNEAAVIWTQWSMGRAPGAAVFPAEDALQKAMRRHVLARSDAPAAADGLTPKMMRKWFASKVANEASEKVLQALLGHAPGSPITRRHYVRSNDDERHEAVVELRMP